MKVTADLLLIALGGILGAWARYGITVINRPAFPFGTLAVNLLGCFIMGLLLFWRERGIASPALVLVLGIGFLGAFTTFSTFSGETLNFLLHGSLARALLYVGASVIGCLLVVWLGYKIAFAVWR